MNFDDDIIIEDKYGSDRNINELLDIDDVNLEKQIQKDSFNFLLKNDIQNNKKIIEDEPVVNKDVKLYEDFKLEKISNNVDSKKYNQNINSEKNIKFIKLNIKSSIFASIFITLFSVIIILLNGDIRKTIWGAFRFPFEVIVFLVLSFYIVKFKKQVPKIAGVNCAVAGFFSGIFISIFKVFYHMEMWTVFNVATESMLLISVGLISGLIFGALLYSTEDSLKNKNYE